MIEHKRYPDARPGATVWAARAGAAGLGLGALALLAPLIWGAFNGALGSLALAALGVLRVGIFQALPYLGQTVENRLLAARKARARAYPIEQLQHFFLQKRERIIDFRCSLAKVAAQIKSMDAMIDKRKRPRPHDDAARQERALKAMQDAHVQLLDQYRKAELALVELSGVGEDKQFEWQFGLAGREALRKLNANSDEELLNDTLADEACDAVRDNFKQVFAELELEAVKSSRTIEHKEGALLRRRHGT